MTPTDTASIQRSIVNTGLSFQQQDDERADEEGIKTKQAKSLQGRALDASNGRTTVARGGLGDNGAHKVASLGTGIGGGHGDDVARRPRRKLCHRIVTPDQQATG